MKVVNAYWEKRNLNMETIEVAVSPTDTISDLISVFRDIEKAEYIVVKIPVGRIDLINKLSSEGFVFIETAFHLSLKPEDMSLSKLQERINKEVEYTPMSETDFSILKDKLSESLFKTDRISLDPTFSIEQSNNRYINWIDDEIFNGASCYQIFYKQQRVGFFTLKSIGKEVYYPFLAALYPDFSHSGFGFTVLSKPIEEVIKRGGRSVATVVSSNNSPILRTHLQLGFSISDMNYVFTKHNKTQ